MDYVLKYKNTDFLVDEVISIQYCRICDDAYGIFRMIKSGITSFEAIDRLACFFNIPTKAIGYAGLKDEDAVTNQHISIPVALIPDINEISRFNDENENANSYINILHLGYSIKNIKISTAMGNSLTIVVRNLEYNLIQTLKSLGGKNKVRVCFPNFYDTQRFGLPNGPKKTHLVGKYLLSGDYEKAFSILKEVESLDNSVINEYMSNPKLFFNTLDERKLSFYFNSHASSIFNEQLNSLMNKIGDTFLHTVSGVNYNLAKKITDFDGIESSNKILEYNSDSINSEGVLVRSMASRPAVLQCYINIGNCIEDEYHYNKIALPVSFFMPAGAYATMVVRQLLCYIEHNGL